MHINFLLAANAVYIVQLVSVGYDLSPWYWLSCQIFKGTFNPIITKCYSSTSAWNRDKRQIWPRHLKGLDNSGKSSSSPCWKIDYFIVVYVQINFLQQLLRSTFPKMVLFLKHLWEWLQLGIYLHSWLNPITQPLYHCVHFFYFWKTSPALSIQLVLN